MYVCVPMYISLVFETLYLLVRSKIYIIIYVSSLLSTELDLFTLSLDVV